MTIKELGAHVMSRASQSMWDGTLLQALTHKVLCLCTVTSDSAAHLLTPPDLTLSGTVWQLSTINTPLK